MLAGSIADSKLSTITTASKVDSTAITGIGALVQGDLIYGSGTDTLALLVKDATATRYLSNTGASNNPAWAQVNLANGVTGDLPYANLTQATAISTLLGRGSGAGAGDWQEITLGTGLSMSGTTLSSSGGGGTGANNAYFPLYCVAFSHSGSNGAIWTNMPAAETQMFGNANKANRRFDATNATEFRIIVYQTVQGSGSTGPDIRLQYSTDGSTGWTNADAAGTELDIGVGTGSKSTAFVTLVSGAKGFYWFRLLGKQGLGASSDPAFSEVKVEFNIPTGTIAGSDTQVLFNDADALAGDAGMTYNKTTDTLTLAGNLQAEDLLIEDSDASHYLTITTTSNLTVARTLTLVPGDADRTITLSGDLTVESASLVNQDLTTDASPQFTALNIGHATDTTLARSGAGDLTIEGNAIYRAGGTDVSLADGGTGASLSDPDDDQIMMWDDSAGAVVFMDIGTGLTINATPVLSVNATLDDIYTNGRSIVMDLDKITFDANDVSNDIFFFDIDIPTGVGTINPFLYDENIVYANGNTYTSVVHNIDVNLNLSGVTGPTN